MKRILYNGRDVASCDFIPDGRAPLFWSCKDRYGRTLTVEDIISIDDGPIDENLPHFSQGEHEHFIAWLSGRVALKEFC